MKKFDAPAAKIDPDDLEFPDWSGMDDSTHRLPVEAAFRLCEEFAVCYRTGTDPRYVRAQKCEVEFVL